MHKIPIKKWSATDYSYLVNNNLGWVSDCQKFYEFDPEDNMISFDRYLKNKELK